MNLVARLTALSQFVETLHGETKVAWRCFGRGPVVVLLHGDFGSWTHWVRNIEPLSKHFRLLVPDMPGYGHSDTPPPPHLPTDLARPLATGLATLLGDDEAVDLVGFSYGGIVAAYLAACLGRRVRRLILSGPGGFGMRSTPPDGIQLRGPRDGMSEDEIHAVHRHNLSTLMFADPQQVDELAVRIQRENIARARVRCGTVPDTTALLDVLPRSRARLCGLWGERDLFSDDDQRALQEAALRRIDADLDFRVVPQAGHWLFYETPEYANRCLLEMLGRPDQLSP